MTGVDAGGCSITLDATCVTDTPGLTSIRNDSGRSVGFVLCDECRLIGEVPLEDLVRVGVGSRTGTS